MNPMMMQLLSKQFGISPEQAMNLTPNDLASFISTRTSDPMMAAMLAQLAMQQSTTASSAEMEDDERDYDRELARLKKTIVQMRQQLSSAEVMARYIADTFGACQVCWGLNRFCAHCGGKGRPGYADPNIEELRKWIDPALKKGGLRIASIE